MATADRQRLPGPDGNGNRPDCHHRGQGGEYRQADNRGTAEMGKLLIYIGLALVAIGLVHHYFPNAFSWFGRLPGDIRIETESGGIYIPVVSMILVSVILTIVVNLLFRK